MKQRKIKAGYETANYFHEKVGTSGSTLGRETTEGVIWFPNCDVLITSGNSPRLHGNSCYRRLALRATRLPGSAYPRVAALLAGHALLGFILHVDGSAIPLRQAGICELHYGLALAE